MLSPSSQSTQWFHSKPAWATNKLPEFNSEVQHWAKSNFRFDRRYSNDVDKSSGLQFDQTVVLGDPIKFREYPAMKRRIGFVDPLTTKRFVVPTNNFTLPTLTITQLYKSRWQVELSFKWIKQPLRIKAFYCTSPNAVKMQIWIAICVYILVAIVKKKLALSHGLYTILQILSVSLFRENPHP